MVLPPPLIAEDGVEHVVAPCAVDAEVASGVAFVLEAGFLQQAPAGGVGREAGGFDAVQAKLTEGEVQSQAGRLAHVAAPGVDFTDPVAERGGLRYAAPDVAEADAADHTVGPSIDRPGAVNLVVAPLDDLAAQGGQIGGTGPRGGPARRVPPGPGRGGPPP